jgi:pilus assembly protein Flp/PilA
MLYVPRDQGQSLVEYALILVLVTILVILILAIFGSGLGNLYSNIISGL